MIESNIKVNNNMKIFLEIDDSKNDDNNVYLKFKAIDKNQTFDFYVKTNDQPKDYYEIIIPGQKGFKSISANKLKIVKKLQTFANKEGNILTEFKFDYKQFKYLIEQTQKHNIEIRYQKTLFLTNPKKEKINFLNFKKIDEINFKLKEAFLIKLNKKLFINEAKQLFLVKTRISKDKDKSKYSSFVFFDIKENISRIEIFFKKLTSASFTKNETVEILNIYKRTFEFNASINMLNNQKFNSKQIKNILESSTFKKRVDVFFDSDLKKIFVRLTQEYANGRKIILSGDKEKTKYLFRNIEAELEFFETISKSFNQFDFKKKLGIIFSNTNYCQLEIILRRLEKDHSYVISIDDYLLNPKKKKTRFISTNIKLNKGFLDIEYVLNGYDNETSKKIIDGYVKNLSLVQISNNEVLNLKEIDFSDLERNLSIINTDIKDLSNIRKIRTNFSNVYFLENFLDNTKVKNKLHKLIKEYEKEQNAIMSPSISNVLRNYQKQGLEWFKKLIHFKFGGILADEMGLGKTIQTIALFDYIYKNSKSNKPSLIICPSSLLYNWKSEFLRFAPYLEIVIVDGIKVEREKILFKQNFGKKIFITSYHLYSRDSDIYLDYEFYATILDEGQMIKNYLTKFSKDVKKINSENRFVLTGTPLENNLWELWSIFEFILPGYLLKKSAFRKNLYEPFLVNDKKLLLEKISPFILRRLKKDVLLDLPNKNEKIIEIDLYPHEEIIYDFEKKRFAKGFANNLNKINNHKNTKKKNQFAILKALTDLRILASSIFLKNNQYQSSAKLDYTINLIKSIIKNKQKTLLFTQFTKNIPFFKKIFIKNKISYLIITGKTNKQKRMTFVNEFNDNDKIYVFIISLKAGGLGLNLTSANNVIHYDPWWNKSIEEQANDRAHRFGQLKGVDVFKLIMKNTIEESVLEIQEQKKALVTSVLENSENIDARLSIDDLLKIIQS